MPTDVKPTPEELQAQIESSTEELEKNIADGDTEIKKDPENDETKNETTDVSEKDESDAGEVDETKDEEEVEVEAEKKKDPDYKKKFSESSRESQKLAAGRRKVNEAVVEASKLDEPTEEELAQEFPDWEDMTDTEKRLAKKTYLGEKRFDLIKKASEDADKIEKWNDKVADFIEDPKSLIDYPDLDGKEEKFKEYANADDHRNIPMDVLVSAFIQKTSQEKPAKKKGKMFEDGTGGANTKDDKNTKGKMTLEEADKLRKVNYAEYKKALTEGRIDTTAV